MPNPVDDVDLATRLGRPLTETERVMSTPLLADAYEEVQARVPDLADRLAAGRVTEGLVRRVLAAMVLRVLRNPEAIRQWSVDDATFTRDQLVSGGMLYASPEEIALLTGIPSGPLPHVSFSAPYGAGR